MMKKKVLDLFNVVVCGIGVILTFSTIIDFMYFLSDPTQKRYYFKNEGVWYSISWSLLINMTLLAIFILSHTLLALDNVKAFFKKYDLSVTCRSLYIITTSLALQLLIKNWHSVPTNIWNVNLNCGPIWWTYFATHSLAWITIYIGNICMDVNELLGIKQVYYKIRNLPDPIYHKSYQLQQLNSHMRHPSFLAFILIFWVVPVMSLDRLLLATLFSFYMYIAWNTTHQDYEYQKSQYILKFHELEHLRS